MLSKPGSKSGIFFLAWLNTDLLNKKEFKLMEMGGEGEVHNKTSRYLSLHKKWNINSKQNNTNSFVHNLRSLPLKICKYNNVSYFNSSGYVNDAVLAKVAFQKWAHWLRICLLLC